jgi:hypothetical protein
MNIPAHLQRTTNKTKPTVVKIPNTEKESIFIHTNTQLNTKLLPDAQNTTISLNLSETPHTFIQLAKLADNTLYPN